jgi:hypothetical protein
MKKLLGILFVLIVIAGCTTNTDAIKMEKTMKTLTIIWQRLLDEKGQTCDRCGLTEKELQEAYHSLKQSLIPLGIDVTLEKKSIDPATCAKDISQSNRIWINEKPLEEWLSARVGKSLCGFCCEELADEVECRTIEVGEHVYETIPADLIVKAGLLAASELINVGSDSPCCEKPINEAPSSDCCP